YQSKSVVVTPKLGDVDVFSVVKENGSAYINYLIVLNGTIIQTKTLKVETHLDETAEEILAFAIGQLRTTFASHAKEIILPCNIDYDAPDVLITVPKGGHKKKLLELSERNVNYFIEDIKQKERLKLQEKNGDKLKLLEQLQKDLQLPELPVNIECFDNSNFQGSFPVSAMVCFKKGEPSKKD